MLDLKHIYNVDLATLNISTIYLNFGYCIGAISGFLYKYINRQLTLVVLLILHSITKPLPPHFPHVYLLFANMFLTGLGMGAWDNSQNVWLLEMWPGKWAHTVLQLSQFIG